MNAIQTLAFALAIFVFTGCDSRPTDKAQPNRAVSAPSVDGYSVYRPEFATTDGTIQAGTAFMIKRSNKQPLLLSALHLLGPDGGLPANIAPKDIGDRVVGITVYDLFEENRKLEFGVDPVLIPDSAPIGEESKYGDVVAFRIPQTTGKVFELAPALPEIGTPVWMFAQLLNGAPQNQRLHRGVYIGIEQGLFIVEFDNPNLELRATSGAPIINSNGEIVAINLGGGESEGVVFGAGNPVSRFAEPVLKGD